MLKAHPFICLFFTALLVVVLITPLVRKLAWKVGAVDYPNKRRINRKPIPRMGGVGVFCALIVSLLLMVVGARYFGWPPVLIPSAGMPVNYYVLAVGVTIAFLTGVIDDIYHLKPLPKLAGQIIAASVAAASGLVVGNIVNPFAGGEIMLGWVAYPVTVIYLVAYMNIINLIDGLDGLSSGIACIASITMFVLAFNAGHPDAASLSIALAGATLGFLFYNFHPASIFLGDSGSLLIGFVMGVVSLLNVTRVAGLTTIIIPLLVAGIPIIDTGSAIIRRMRAHVSVGQADRGHIHHRLIQEGFDQRGAVLLIYAWTAFLCLGSFIMTQVEVWPRTLIFCVLIVASSAFAAKLHLFEPVLRHHYDPDTGHDELIGPDDPAFEEETRRAEQAAEEHREHIVNELLHHRANNHMDEVAAQEDTDKQSVEHTDDSSKQ
ncbi:glycosyltransferase family 4 protein [Olsenella sp. Marseille-QA0557]|uniref:Undecaprenyl/decaprenyl-phosphate alpha-N-acetylglucosaminyl 1-phosphate transferase n=1 Tax=Candidatus Coprovicinus avistercoris TaxID=2840754 RepID=A0A9D1L419_9ACTN|nr:undecaprenyl/decaprenyl-phosphate alpha-N-acetylglucosaminyl 1-phosphate transferase [Candidatus Coprovicinus avistercoris]